MRASRAGRTMFIKMSQVEPLDLSPSSRPTGESAREPGKGTEGRPRTPSFSVDYMDPSVDPAADFYRYACGRWLDANQIPSDKARWGVLSELADRNFVQMREIMEEASRAEGEPSHSPRRQVGDLFASAMDGRRREARGFRPVSPELRRIAG